MLNHNLSNIPWPKAVLFDWDMTLANSWQAIYTALNNTLEKFGHPIWTEEQAKENSQQALRDYFPVVFGNEHEKARDFFYHNFKKIHLDHIEAMPHTHEVVAVLEDYNIPMGIVSNKNQVFLPKEAEKLGFADMMRVMVGAGSADKDKPHPAPVLKALEALEQEPGRHIWYIGDSITDARTAVASGSTNIIISGDQESVQEFPEEIQPDAYFPNMQTFLGTLSDYLRKNRDT